MMKKAIVGVLTDNSQGKFKMSLWHDLAGWKWMLRTVCTRVGTIHVDRPKAFLHVLLS